MMKLILLGAVAFVLGLGGTTGVMVLTSPALPPGADSLAVRAAAARSHAAPAEPAKAGEDAKAPPVAKAATVGTPVPVSIDAPPAGEPSADAHAATDRPRETVVPPAPIPVVRATRPPAAPDAESYKQVGNILMNMKPAEAARILAYLSDAQVEGLLRSMTPRNAATVLSQLPSERAAALSKRLLVPAPEEKR